MREPTLAEQTGEEVGDDRHGEHGREGGRRLANGEPSPCGAGGVEDDRCTGGLEHEQRR